MHVRNEDKKLETAKIHQKSKIIWTPLEKKMREIRERYEKL